ncbi:hypothetical protein DPMN_147660 [Dreissena polymorpha]|uniref:Uncharacterized protein n=1 Tax=Dreissena polymorpha TaxID=45954 RepID=A0A9D4FAA4_DREPO|nr:hypothetical protein DPMN_147660 [Dreissena polymorpha]
MSLPNGRYEPTSYLYNGRYELTFMLSNVSSGMGALSLPNGRYEPTCMFSNNGRYEPTCMYSNPTFMNSTFSSRMGTLFCNESADGVESIVARYREVAAEVNV